MKKVAFTLGLFVFIACGRGGSNNFELDAAYTVFGTDFPLEPPLDYSSNAPNYIYRDNRLGGDVDDRKATLGRVLFYDKHLSLNNSISCGSCHIQSHAFGDTSQQSIGLNGGLTSRQSMRLVASWRQSKGSSSTPRTQRQPGPKSSSSGQVPNRRM